MARLLVVEDDEALGRQVVEQLREAGHHVVWWRRGRSLSEDDLDELELVVLDLMLPGLPGLEILADIRRHSSVPVLVLSARQDSHDKVRALELGADDYLTKPFWPAELLARVKARLRRPDMRTGDVLCLGPLQIHTAARQVFREGEYVHLTPTEFQILRCLAERAGEAVARRWLVSQALDPEREGMERTLDVHVSRLRRKLGEPLLIETVWGLGYRFREPPV